MRPEGNGDTVPSKNIDYLETTEQNAVKPIYKRKLNKEKKKTNKKSISSSERISRVRLKVSL